MKIHKLKFKNLNSLQGEWEINFTAQEYNGIFAVTGPTGAGKSTILDAVCLALYGKTPRLERINSSHNEIMSRKTAECYSEVVFESQAGLYMCSWSQHRAHNSPSGNLTDYKHEITDLRTNKLLESRKAFVQKMIEEKIGMDYKRFVKSVLLAQGAFSAFLFAGYNEKSEILEQLTGTQIYSDISIEVHERFRTEKEKLKILNAEMATIKLLTSNENINILKQLENLSELEKSNKETIDKFQSFIDWHQKIQLYKVELQKLYEERSKNLKEQENFKEKELQLKRALIAADLESDYALLCATRQNYSDNSRKLNDEQVKLENTIKQLGEKEKKLADCNRQLTAAKELYSAELLVTKKVIVLDERIQSARIESGESSGALENAVKRLTQSNEKFQELQKETVLLTEQKDKLDGYLEVNSKDEDLKFLIDMAKEYHENLKRIDNGLALTEAKFAEVKNKYSMSDIENCNAELVSVTQKLSTVESELESLLNGKSLEVYRKEKEDILKNIVYKDIASEREKLIHGEPCPLCGSTEHPFAQNPPADETELDRLTILIINAIELQEQILVISKSEKKLSEKKRDMDKYIDLKENYENDLAKLTKERITLQNNISLKFNGDKSFDDIVQLEIRHKKWLDSVAKVKDVTNKMTDNDIAKKIIAGECDLLRESIKELEIKKEQSSYKLKGLQNERNMLYADKDPSGEEKRLNDLVVLAEQETKQAADDLQIIKNISESTNGIIKNIGENLLEIKDKLKDMETRFIKKLDGLFADEKSFCAAVLPADVRKTLADRLENLQHTMIQLNAFIGEKEKLLTAEADKKMTDMQLEDIQNKMNLLHIESRLNNEESGRLKNILEENEKNKIIQLEKTASKERQELVSADWGRLDQLIGSADGKKYRSYVQGITFDIMLEHANKQLEKMTERYALVRDNAGQLELSVIDYYQAGEVRPVKNLSGGESFLVSLALALGLAAMASKNIRIDTLFLDEGFGTLDEESMGTALDALSTLQHEGKLIGIVSHMAALKERISAQINVQPVRNGISVLSGPGVQKIS